MIGKKGFIVPFYKGNDKPQTSTDSYRPISLLPGFHKVFEKVLISRLNKGNNKITELRTILQRESQNS